MDLQFRWHASVLAGDCAEGVAGHDGASPERHYLLKKNAQNGLELRKYSLWQGKMGTVGYQFLCESLGLNVFAPERPAIVKSVTRVEPTDGFLV
jgi:hypothetical protein